MDTLLHTPFILSLTSALLATPDNNVIEKKREKKDNKVSELYFWMEIDLKAEYMVGHQCLEKVTVIGNQSSQP